MIFVVGQLNTSFDRISLCHADGIAEQFQTTVQNEKIPEFAFEDGDFTPINPG